MPRTTSKHISIYHHLLTYVPTPTSNVSWPPYTPLHNAGRPHPPARPPHPTMPPNPTTLTTRPTSTARTRLIHYHLFLYLLLLFTPPNNNNTTTALAQVAPFPFPFPVLPQEFASKTACREVYDQCMQAFRDCLAAVAGNEPGRLGCEAYRNDVCEEHIRVGCDQLPNGGGSISEVCIVLRRGGE